MIKSRNIKFREDKVMIILPKSFFLTSKRTMYVHDAPCSLISYQDLRASKIHIYSALENNEEVLELRQGRRILATANTGDDNLYKTVVNLITISSISLID